MQIGIHGGEEKPRVNWPLPEWDTAIAPRRASERVTANLYLRSTGVASVLTRADQPTNGYRPIGDSNNYLFINRRIFATRYRLRKKKRDTSERRHI